MALDAPGGGEILDSPLTSIWPTGAQKVTASGWYFTCIPASDGGQGLRGHAPDGSQYDFTRYITRQADKLGTHLRGGGPVLERTRHILAASQVRDVHGNTVDYSYDGQGRLFRIEASDGRRIDLTYSGSDGLVRSVTANPGLGSAQTWLYAYGGESPSVTVGGEHFPNILQQVVRPDGLAWTYELIGMSVKPERGESCFQLPQTLSITHPFGMTGEWRLQETHHRTSFDLQQVVNKEGCYVGDFSTGPGPSSPEWRLITSRTMSVAAKTLSAPSSPEMVWSYRYESDRGPAGSSSADRTNWTRVTRPDGSEETFYHLWTAEPMGGNQVRREVRDAPGGSLLQSVQTTYAQEVDFGLAMIGSGLTPDSGRRPARVTQTVLSQGGDVYTTSATYDLDHASPTYSHGGPLQITRSSTVQSSQRVSAFTYRHLSSPWRLRLPETVTDNGVTVAAYTYDASGRMTREDRFGAVNMRFGYHSSTGEAGALAWYEDAISRRVTLDDYHRGAPQTVTRRDGVVLTSMIDDMGRVKSRTDGRGTTVNYYYDAGGRLIFIDNPAGYDDTAIGYSGLGSGPTQTITNNALQIVVEYDAMLRPLREERRARFHGGGSIYTRYEYDAKGRTVFQSFPAAVPNPSAGVNTSYDALGRVVRTEETVSPFAATVTSYLSSNRVQVADPAGNVTTTWRSGYGGPDDGEPVRIDHPLGLVTEMSYDAWGNLITARQSGSHSGVSVDETQSWAYDSRQRLCRHATPQSGHTLYDYDAANQLIGVARGAPAGSGCAPLPGGLRVATSYDLLGQVDLVDFPDSSPDIDLDHDANGNLVRAARGISVWAYSYDAMDRLTAQALSLDGRVYLSSQTYTSEGRLLTRTTPDGRTIHFSPNGHGAPTGAWISGVHYAQNAAYHPSGDLAAVEYGNGLLHVANIDARQQIVSTRLSAGSVSRLYSVYGRDALGRVTTLTDHVTPGESRSFSYDALGRLTGATGPWGSGTYTYDLLNNLRGKTLGSRFVDLDYDAQGRLERYRDSGAGGVWHYQTYDDRGNIISDGTNAFFYDRSERPVQISGPALGTMVYDAHGRRVKQTFNGETIYSVYGLDGALLYRDNASTGETTDYIAMGGHSVGRFDAAGAFTWVHSDHLGGAAAASDANGHLIWTESYTPFGEVRHDPAANRDEPGFTGHIRDAASGLTYAQARFYNPALGRFLAPDPVGFADMGPGYFQRYAYTAGDPVNRIDPGGEVWGKVARFGAQVIRSRGNVRAAGRQFVSEVRRDGGTLIGRHSTVGERMEAAFNLASPLSVKEVAAIGAGAASAAAAITGGNEDSTNGVTERLEVDAPYVEPIPGETAQEFFVRITEGCKQACIDAYGDVDGAVPFDGITDILQCTNQCREDVMSNVDEDEYFPE